MFECDKCGKCCRSLNLSDLYEDLDNGDGVCRYLYENTNLCTIYENRPKKCNIDEMYMYFNTYMTIEKYYNLNHMICKKLKGE